MIITLICGSNFQPLYIMRRKDVKLISILLVSKKVIIVSIEMQNEFWYQLRKYKESNKEVLICFLIYKIKIVS